MTGDGAVPSAGRHGEHPGDETGWAGAECRGRHPGRVGAQGGSCSAWGTGPLRGQETGRRKEKKWRKRKREREREEKEKETPAGFAAAVASACSSFGGKQRARNEEEQGRDDDLFRYRDGGIAGKDCGEFEVRTESK